MGAILEKATLAGGCFWCVEAIFQELIGVKSVVSGYMGGSKVDPTYREVCSGTTGHAEVAQITFDASRITFGDILKVFWSTHDPTTLNRQGHDHGTQYRSAIFYHDAGQEEQAISSRDTIGNELWGGTIVTEIVPASTFYPAENYHQEYYQQNPNQGYCRTVITPKVNKFRKQFAKQLKSNAGA